MQTKTVVVAPDLDRGVLHKGELWLPSTYDRTITRLDAVNMRFPEHALRLNRVPQ